MGQITKVGMDLEEALALRCEMERIVANVLVTAIGMTEDDERGTGLHGNTINSLYAVTADGVIYGVLYYIGFTHYAHESILWENALDDEDWVYAVENMEYNIARWKAGRPLR